MSYYESLVYYYLLTKQKSTNIYNSIIVNLFGYTNISTIVNKQKVSLIPYFILYNLINNLIVKLEKIKQKMNVNINSVEITKISLDGERTMIIDDSNIDFKKINNIISNSTIDTSMLKNTVLLFEIVNGDNKICLKNFLNKYKDYNKEYNNTIKNLLDYNGIYYNSNSIVNIKGFFNKKMITKTYNINEILGNHITELY